MGLLRSEEMSYGTLVLPAQDARRYMEVVGMNTNLQIEDMNAKEMRRPYRKQIQRLDEIERQLRFVTEEVKKASGGDIVTKRYTDFLDNQDAYKLEEVEAQLSQLYGQFQIFNENNEKLTAAQNAASEELEVVKLGREMLVGTDLGSNFIPTEDNFEASASAPLLEDGGGRRLASIAGVVFQEDQARFEFAVFRASLGNTLVKFTPIGESADPKTGQMKEKSVFVIYFQSSTEGGDKSAMEKKVDKVCAAFGVNLYGWPRSLGEALLREKQLVATLQTGEKAMEAFQDMMSDEIKNLVDPPRVGANSRIEDLRLFCMKEKSIYHELNKCSDVGVSLQVSCWYPTEEFDQIRTVLRENSTAYVTAALVPSRAHELPPTFTKSNDLTEGWQLVIDTYGFPRYKESNPALLAVVTFPFCFGMMYGDIGHGFMLFCAGLSMCALSDKLKFGAPDLYRARFMITQMGFFAVFCGFIYNDFFSIGVPLFESRWEDPDGDGQYTAKASYDITNSGGGGPYPLGIDSAWHGSTNELLFMNSLKMKVSVLFGVAQMIIGVFLRWGNAIYERNTVDFVFECIPMMVFMVCFFGWMDAMILYKWTHKIDAAPSIINSLICMAMGQEDKNPLWDGSVELSKRLMIYTVAAVPFLLFPKPLILLAQNNSKKGKKGADDEESQFGGHGHGGEFDFAEVFIHQVIETIEYVLGTVSHTASYLRIWALSLAHQQLSLVFFQKTIQMGLAASFPMNMFGLYFSFACWFGITVGVLLGMDVLECFLHTLRLHWVEFQSKFYHADGYPFEPYSIKGLVMTPVD